MSNIKPIIDDQFWFDRSGEMIKDASNRLNTWADRVRDMIVWAFSLYTAGSILTVEFKKIDEWWLLAILAIPYLLIIIVYWQSQAAQVPINVSFHPDSSTQIKKAYQDAYADKSKRVNNLIRWSFVALFSVAIALITALIIKNEQRDTNQGIPKSNYFNGILEKKGDKTYLVVTGMFPPDSLLSINTSCNYYDERTKKTYSKDSSFSILNLHNGVLQHLFVTDTLTNHIVYEISWSEDNYKKTLQKKFITKSKVKKMK